MANEKFKINGVVSEVVPTIGTTGDILKKTGSGVEWGALTKATQTQDGLLNKEDFKKLAGIQAGAQVNTVISVNGQTGVITTPDTTYDVVTTSANGLMSSADKVKLNGVETGAQKNNVTSTDIANWNNKVDKVSGKQLSTNDYTTVEKNKLAGIETGAQKNIMTSADKVKLDKFTEVENKPYYNGEEIGGTVPNLTLNELTLGGRFKISYNDDEDSLDIEVI